MSEMTWKQEVIKMHLSWTLSGLISFIEKLLEEEVSKEHTHIKKHAKTTCRDTDPEGKSFPSPKTL